MSKCNNKVIIMGLNSLNNYGDNFILQCIKYVVNELGTYNSEIIDVEPSVSLIRMLMYYIVLVVSKICPVKNLKYKLVFLAVQVRCKKKYKKSLLEAGALIFGMGSFKYGTQKLWAYYSLAIEVADPLNIPVMFNAMSIQRYDASDWRCQFLMKHTNRKCVKVITSRDGEFGVDRLMNDYRLKKDIMCAGVGDVAFWIPECYGIKKECDSDIIGINLINGNTFIRYGNRITEVELINIYVNLLNLLDKNHVKWELYTNGLKSDYEFGMKLLRRYGNTNVSIKTPESDIDLLRTICRYKRILGARLHSCIAAYSLDVPFVGFIWDEKLYFFSKMAEIEKCFVEEGFLCGELLFQMIMGEDIVLSDEQKELREVWKLKTRNNIDIFLNKYMKQ